MTRFKPSDFKINTAPAKATEIKVTTLDQNLKPEIKTFDFNEFKKPGAEDYEKVKAKFGPLAATDAERNSRHQKDRRFAMNPLLKEPLSIEQEERRVMEEKVRARIQTLAEEAKAQAAALGYQEGLNKGFDEAFKRVQAEGAESLQKLDQLVSEAEKAKEEIFRANERFLIELVFRIARMVVLKELSTDKDYVLRLAKELVARVGVRDNITLKINPEDAQTIESLKEGIEKAYGKLSNLNIEASSQVNRGGCRIETQWNAIDASIDTQLQGIGQALVGQREGQST